MQSASSTSAGEEVSDRIHLWQVQEVLHFCCICIHPHIMTRHTHTAGNITAQPVMNKARRYIKLNGNLITKTLKDGSPEMQILSSLTLQNQNECCMRSNCVSHANIHFEYVNGMEKELNKKCCPFWSANILLNISFCVPQKKLYIWTLSHFKWLF